MKSKDSLVYTTFVSIINNPTISTEERVKSVGWLIQNDYLTGTEAIALLEEAMRTDVVSA